MGQYIAQSDIESIFGVVNVQKWSKLDNTAGADATRIANAIEHAEAVVEDRLRSQYAIPLTGIGVLPPIITDWCAKLAGVWLYEARGIADASSQQVQDIIGHKSEVAAEIGLYVAGARTLRCVRASNGPTAPVVIGGGL